MSDERQPGAPGACEAVELPLAQFTLIYESKDGKLCVFEDAGGHLTAVRAEKLA